MGEYTFDYACLLIEDNQKYGYLTQTDKDIFYAACEPEEQAEEENNEY